MVGLRAPIFTNRIHRVGKWIPKENSGETSHGRPLLVEFRYQHDRDSFLACAAKIAEETGGRYNIAPDTYRARTLSLSPRNNPRQDLVAIGRPVAYSLSGSKRDPGDVDEAAWVSCSELNSSMWSVNTDFPHHPEDSTLMKEPLVPLVDISRQSLGTSSTPKNVPSPRVLRPRVKQD